MQVTGPPGHLYKAPRSTKPAYMRTQDVIRFILSDIPQKINGKAAKADGLAERQEQMVCRRAAEGQKKQASRAAGKLACENGTACLSASGTRVLDPVFRVGR